MKIERRTYTAEFKLQMVKLYENGKSRFDIAREYDITPAALDCWISNHQKTGSFTAEDNRSVKENELIQLRKENQRLKMEIDILKQAALIMRKMTSAGPSKDAALVYKALSSIQGNLTNVQFFHIDIGS